MSQHELILDYGNDSYPDCNITWTPSFTRLALSGGRDGPREGLKLPSEHTRVKCLSSSVHSCTQLLQNKIELQAIGAFNLDFYAGGVVVDTGNGVY